LNELTSYARSESGNVLGAQLTPIARAAGAANLENFVQRLRWNRPAHVHNGLSEAMLINETSFFRDFAPFELLQRSVLPKLIEQNRNERKLKIWSAASSTGQEAYSLAMMLCEHFPLIADWDVEIVATDISGNSIEYAERGRYRRLEINRGLPVRMLMKYFVRDGEEWRVCEKVRSMVEFLTLDLRRPLPDLPEFDLVLLRNVLLYFPERDRGMVLREVHRTMDSRGALLLGSAEQAEDSTDLFGAVFEGGSYYYQLKSR
jgi:chemotaxis protein methyltransferase CheR